MAKIWALSEPNVDGFFDRFGDDLFVAQGAYQGRFASGDYSFEADNDGRRASAEAVWDDGRQASETTVCWMDVLVGCCTNFKRCRLTR